MNIKDRIQYSAIVDRKPLKLADGGRVIVWPIVNLEEWVPSEPLPRRILTPPGDSVHVPDIPNWCCAGHPQLVLVRVRHADRDLADHGGTG
jgi:hypothetical protein